MTTILKEIIRDAIITAIIVFALLTIAPCFMGVGEFCPIMEILK